MRITTKADFKATREYCGLSQADVARDLNVNVQTVKSWEHPQKWEIPADVVAYMELQAAAHDEYVRVAIEEMLRATRGIPASERPVIELTYYRNQGDYDTRGRDVGSVGVVNARARSIAQALRELGYEVRFCYPGESLAATLARDAPSGD